MDTKDAERILKLFADSLEQGKDFAVSEAPEVVQQLILWKRVEYGVIVAVLLLFGVICWRVMVNCGKLADKEEVHKDGSSSDWRYGQVLGAVVGLCLLTALIGVNIYSLRVWLAPKVYVLEYAAELLR